MLCCLKSSSKASSTNLLFGILLSSDSLFSVLNKSLSIVRPCLTLDLYICFANGDTS